MDALGLGGFQHAGSRQRIGQESRDIGAEAAATLGADAAPLADQQDAAEQVGRSWRKVPSGEAGWNSQRRADVQAVVAEFVTIRTDANQRGRLREQRQLDGNGPLRAGCAASGHEVPRSVAATALPGHRNRVPAVGGAGCHTTGRSVTATAWSPWPITGTAGTGPALTLRPACAGRSA